MHSTLMRLPIAGPTIWEGSMMLVAETRGKRLKEAENHEDYLTSSTFGHLRYIKPNLFWHELLSKAKPSTHDESPLTTKLPYSIAEYENLQSYFWHRGEYGEPDLILRFTGDGLPPIIILIEVKLWSSKSGEKDQLAKYFDILDDLGSAKVPSTDHDLKFMLFLTPRDATAEIKESLSSLPEHHRDNCVIYKLEWQQVLKVAKEESENCSGMEKDILRDVAEFLRRRGLEYFDKFSRNDKLVDLVKTDGSFYSPKVQWSGLFHGFKDHNELSLFSMEHGGWVND